MISSGSLITNAQNGNLGIVLNVQPVARATDGSTIAQYQAVEVNARTQSSQPNQTAFQHTRPVDARTLTEAQARAGGVSASDYRKALEAAKNKQDAANPDAAKSPGDLSQNERAELAQLQARDAAVRQEEKGHAAAAGQYGSAPQYEYQVGPDGQAYAIGGHVDMHIAAKTGSKEDINQALTTLQNAALSPNAPSAADLSAYRQATRLKDNTLSSESTPSAFGSDTNGPDSRESGISGNNNRITGRTVDLGI